MVDPGDNQLLRDCMKIIGVVRGAELYFSKKQYPYWGYHISQLNADFKLNMLKEQ